MPENQPPKEEQGFWDGVRDGLNKANAAVSKVVEDTVEGALDLVGLTVKDVDNALGEISLSSDDLENAGKYIMNGFSSDYDKAENTPKSNPKSEAPASSEHQAQNVDQTVSSAKANIMKVQGALADAGFNIGTNKDGSPMVDGIAGDLTTQAIDDAMEAYGITSEEFSKMDTDDFVRVLETQEPIAQTLQSAAPQNHSEKGQGYIEHSDKGLGFIEHSDKGLGFIEHSDKGQGLISMEELGFDENAQPLPEQNTSTNEGGGTLDFDEFQRMMGAKALSEAPNVNSAFAGASTAAPQNDLNNTLDNNNDLQSSGPSTTPGLG